MTKELHEEHKRNQINLRHSNTIYSHNHKKITRKYALTCWPTFVPKFLLLWNPATPRPFPLWLALWLKCFDSRVTANVTRRTADRSNQLTQLGFYFSFVIHPTLADGITLHYIIHFGNNWINLYGKLITCYKLKQGIKILKSEEKFIPIGIHKHERRQWVATQISRDAGAGGEGGAVGTTCPHNLEAVGPPPQLWTVNVVHFYFCLFLHGELEYLPISQK